ncbi:MAG: tetratricopeptide repeat protein [Bacteroidaceae bacterium]|nr:tetratricopeptide repeat protein [Bacteroidaceae bacterium]
MNLKQHIHILPLLLLALILLCACSSRKNNTAKTRMYHSFFAKYNTFYNGNVSFKESKKMQLNGHKDNYLELLPLMINSSETTNKIGTSGLDRAIEKSQKAIKNHSIKRKPKKPAGKKLSEKKKRFYAQKEFNPFLWQAWFMMADAYFAKGEFTEAASTYIYISRLYENNPKIVAQARIGLAKCYNELDWIYESEDLLNRIKRDSLPTSLAKEYAHARAGLLLKQQRHSEAAEQIKSAVKRKGSESLDKAREYYLIGQLYKMQGNNKEAFKYFGKTISQNPPYELEFNARIRQTECLTNQNKKSILRKLNRMARSSKNKSYLPQIYYAIGNVHLSHKDTTEAVKAYEKGFTEGDGSGYGSGMLGLSLGKIYWEQEKFSKSKENYEKAQQLLGEDTPEKDEIKFRSEVLAELVQYTDVVEEKSELLYWASLPQEQLLPIIDERIKEAKEKEKLQKKQERKEKRQSAADNLANASTAAAMTTTTPQDAGKWYFYNPAIVARGIKSFAHRPHPGRSAVPYP